MARTSVKKALQYASDHPQPDTDIFLDLHAHYLLGRQLFTLANNSDYGAKGGLTTATKAQKLILDRLVGLRRAGTHPVARKAEEITFHDLTVSIGGGSNDDNGHDGEEVPEGSASGTPR